MSNESQEAVQEAAPSQEAGKNQEAQQAGGSSSEGAVSYSNEEAQGLDEFLNGVPGVDSQTPEEKTAESTEEGGTEGAPQEISAEDQKKIDALLSKAEEEGLSEEEISFMKGHGYEVEEDTSEEGSEEKKPEEGGDPDKKPDTEEVINGLPEDFVKELDDLFSDDENYNPESLSDEERLSYAQKAISTFRTSQAALQETLADNPELSGFISDVVKEKMDPAAAIKKHFGDLLQEEAPKAGTPEYDKWIIQKEDDKRNKKRLKELQDEQRNNLQKSAQYANEFIKENKWNDSQRKEFNELIDQTMQDLSKGIVSKDFLNMIKKGLNYDQDVKKAEQAGEVKGANRKIRLKKRAGDNMPRVKSSQKTPKPGVTYADETAEGLDKFLNNS